MPVFGGVVLDTTALAGIVAVDATSGVVEVLAGTFGPDLERELQDGHGLSVGHFPQSFDIATVGGWVACRGAGQYSTRYGKIEDLVVGLEVVLADGTVVRTGGAPAAAVGPDLTQLFLGSEGTLGVVTRVWLRAHPVAPAERRAAWSFASFADGIEACRRVLHRGATPAVLRLYDGVESARGHGGDGTRCALLVLDEGDPAIVDATMAVVADCCAAAGGEPAPGELVAGWLAHRNDTSALQGLTRKGFVVDTMEIAALVVPAARTCSTTCGPRSRPCPHALAASCHLSHSYRDGACLYFTFAATPPADEVEATYVRCGTPASGPCSPAAATCRTTTASGSTGPGSWPRPSGPGSTCWPRSRRRSTRAASSTPASSACRRRSGRRRGRRVRAVTVARPAGTGTPSGPGRASPSCSPSRSRSPPAGPPTRATTRRSPSGSASAPSLGFVLGAGCAAWVQRTGTPLSHGLVTAIGTYLAAQAVFAVVRLARGQDVRWFAIMFNLTVVLGAGLLGGLLGQLLRSRGVLPGQPWSARA